MEVSWPQMLAMLPQRFSTQLAMMFFAFALAIMLSFGIENIWLLYAVAFGRGVATSFNQPARQAMAIPSPVEPRGLVE